MKQRIAALLAVSALAYTAAPAARAQAPAWQTAVALAQTGGQLFSVASTAADASGNILVAGNFDGTLTLGATTLTSAGGDDGFVAKWSPASQQFVWALRLGGPDDDAITSVAASGTSVYIGGGFAGTAVFGPATLTPTGASDAFVAKLTDAGTTASFGWARQAGGTGTADAALVSHLAVSGPVVYAAGRFEGRLGATGPAQLIGAGGEDGFVLKFTDAGTTATPGWAQGLGGPLDDQVVGLAVQASNVYVTGLFADTLRAGALSLTSGGDDDGFLVKVRDAGAAPAVAWGQTMGGPGNDALTGIAVRGNDLYVTGAFSGTRTLGNSTLVSQGEEDVLVMKLLDAGPAAAVTWAIRGGGPDQDVPYALTLAGNNVFVSGFFVGPATYGPSTLPASSAGNDDVLVARVLDAGSTGRFVWAQQASSAVGNDYGNALTVVGNRVYVVGDVGQLPATFGPLTLAGTTPDAGFLAAIFDPTLLVSARAAAGPAPATLAPNPARHTTTLALPAAAEARPLLLLDATGRELRRTLLPARAESTALDLRGLPAGLYLVRCADATHRLVVE